MDIRTTKAIHKNHALPHIIQPHSAIDAPCHDLLLSNMQTAHAVPTFLEDLYRLRWLAFAIPNPDSSVKAAWNRTMRPKSVFPVSRRGSIVPKQNWGVILWASGLDRSIKCKEKIISTTDYDAVPIPPKPNAVHPAEMPAPSPQSPRSCDVPKENLFVATHTRESRIVICDSNIKDLVSMRRVGLDKPRFGVGGIQLRRIEQLDRAIRRTSENLRHSSALSLKSLRRWELLMLTYILAQASAVGYAVHWTW